MYSNQTFHKLFYLYLIDFFSQLSELYNQMELDIIIYFIINVKVSLYLIVLIFIFNHKIICYCFIKGLKISNLRIFMLMSWMKTMKAIIISRNCKILVCICEGSCWRLKCYLINL